MLIWNNITHSPPARREGALNWRAIMLSHELTSIVDQMDKNGEILRQNLPARPIQGHRNPVVISCDLKRPQFNRFTENGINGSGAVRHANRMAQGPRTKNYSIIPIGIVGY